MKKIQMLEEGKEPTRRDEPDQVFEKPIFTNLLTGPSELWEGQRAHFEARVVPVGDPTMRYLWYCNGVELKMGKINCYLVIGTTPFVKNQNTHTTNSIARIFSTCTYIVHL